MPGKNDNVHYGAYGVCQVEDLRSIRFGPDTPRREYYVLRPVDQDGACIYVPTDNPTLTGRMRPVLSRGEVDRLLASVREERLPWVEDRRQRLDAPAAGPLSVPEVPGERAGPCLHGRTDPEKGGGHDRPGIFLLSPHRPAAGRRLHPAEAGPDRGILRASPPKRIGGISP